MPHLLGPELVGCFCWGPSPGAVFSAVGMYWWLWVEAFCLVPWTFCSLSSRFVYRAYLEGQRDCNLLRFLIEILFLLVPYGYIIIKVKRNS